jgi:multicomponent Na+:H+ antiporter subunit B
LILRTTTRLLLAVLLLFSVFLLLRGHDLPGGGFIGGLVAASALALYALAFGSKSAAALMPLGPRPLMGLGLSAAALAGLLALVVGRPFLTGLWFVRDVGDYTLKLSTPLLFDVGVYLVVIGVVLTMVFALEDD